MPYKNPHPLFTVWWSMIQRCRNPRSRAWKDYGGRGISVCERWKDSFRDFVADMGERPSGYVIDRIDNDGNYEPPNCRWASRKVSQRNQRQTRLVIIDGVSYIAADLAERAGVKVDTVIDRVKEGRCLAEVVAGGRLPNHTWMLLGAAKLAKTHCPAGHPYSGDNLVLTKAGYRECRACRNGVRKARRRERERRNATT